MAKASPPRPDSLHCPTCGSNLIGNGHDSPIRCIFADVPLEAEPDSGPWYCEEFVSNKGPLPANPVMLPSEALFGFAAWLTCLEKPVLLGANYDASEAVDLLKNWCQANKLEDVRDGVYPKNMEYPTIDTRTSLNYESLCVKVEQLTQTKAVMEAQRNALHQACVAMLKGDINAYRLMRDAMEGVNI